QKRRQAAMVDAGLKRWIDAAPRASAAGLDPFDAFRHYPTFAIAAGSRVGLVLGADTNDLAAALDHGFFDGLAMPRRVVEAMFARLQPADLTISDLASGLGVHVALAARGAGLLVKLGLARIDPATASRQATSQALDERGGVP